MDKIIFRKLNNPYGEFSNFYPSLIYIDGKRYATVEHYYQSKKFEGNKFEEKVRRMPTAWDAKKAAWSEITRPYIDPMWDEHKLFFMAKALKAKFEIERFKNLLLNTGNIEIVEYSKNDYYWGRNEDGAGCNMLGKMLMDLREHIRASEDKKHPF